MIEESWRHLIVNLAIVLPYDKISAFAAKYVQLHELARRAAAIKQIGKRNFPQTFLFWAQRMEIPVDPDLVAAIEARGIQIADWKTFDDLKALNEQQTATHEKALAERQARWEGYVEAVAKLGRETG